MGILTPAVLCRGVEALGDGVEGEGAPRRLAEVRLAAKGPLRRLFSRDDTETAAEQSDDNPLRSLLPAPRGSDSSETSQPRRALPSGLFDGLSGLGRRNASDDTEPKAAARPGDAAAPMPSSPTAATKTPTAPTPESGRPPMPRIHSAASRPTESSPRAQRAPLPLSRLTGSSTAAPQSGASAGVASEAPATATTAQRPATSQDGGTELRSHRRAGTVDQVHVTLEVGGSIEHVEDGVQDSSKLSVLADFQYEERTLSYFPRPKTPCRAVRYYEKADASILVDQAKHAPALRPNRRIVAVDYADETLQLYSPEGTLTSEELDLLDVQGNSLLLAHLLPQDPVQVGATWAAPETVVQTMLQLDTAPVGEIQCVLTKLDARHALIEMAGGVEGGIDGAATEIEVKGKLQYDRQRQRVTWLGMLIKEKRSVGPIGPGLDVVARLEVTVRLKDGAEHLSDATLAELDLEPDGAKTRLVHSAADGDWQLQHGRGWVVTHDVPTRSILRKLDKGEFVAQLNVSMLPEDDAEGKVTLEQFQNDIRHGLGERFGQFVHAAAETNEAGYRQYRVEISGSSGDSQLRWIYYLLTDRQGKQAVLGFVIDETMLERFETSDRELVAGFRLTGAEASSTAGSPPEAERTNADGGSRLSEAIMLR